MMKMKTMLFGLLVLAASVKANVVPNTLFNENAVLQRNADVPVWGTANEGEKVTVEFAGQKVSTVTVKGKWMVALKPLKAGGPFVMTIKGDNTITLGNILVGEVWVCSGQSNMAMLLAYRSGPKQIVGFEKERDAADYPEIRQFRVPYNASGVPVDVAKGNWVLCSPQAVTGFSAVGYFFASDLYRKLKVPIGLLFSAVGGTTAESWTSYNTLLNTPQQERWALSYTRSINEFPAKLEQYKVAETALLAKYQVDVEQAQKDKKPAPKKPEAPKDPASSGSAGGLYNGMIVPLQPYAIKGVIWYQGESNNANASIYQSLFSAMITDWRRAWGQGNYPFLFVQIAPNDRMTPELRESQALTLTKTANTAMAVITDYGDSADIHPVNKQPVGARLALAARALAYQEKIEYSGPVYDTMAISGSEATLTFTHQKKLIAKDGALKGFVIAGSDGVFVPATATIKGKTVVVSNPSVSNPTAVRFGWANVPDVNLFNEADLPASPFRTDKHQSR